MNREERNRYENWLAKLGLVLFLLLAGAVLRGDAPKTAGIPWDKALHFSCGYIVTDVATRATDR